MSRQPSDIRHLEPEAVAGFVPAFPMDLQVLRGRVWVTEEGCPEDQVLDAGARVRLECGGEVVIQALTSADVRIRSAQPGRPSSSFIRAWGADWIRRLDAARTRLQLGHRDVCPFAP